MDDDFFNDVARQNGVYSYGRDDEDDLFRSSSDEGNAFFPSTANDLFNESQSEWNAESPVAFDSGGWNSSVAARTRSVLSERKKPLIIVATSLIALAGACFTIAARPFTVDLIASAKRPDIIANLYPNSQVFCGDRIVGKVSKVAYDDSKGGAYARLKIKRGDTPKNDAKFVLKETPQGYGVEIVGGSRDAPPMSRGQSVVLRDKKRIELPPMPPIPIRHIPWGALGGFLSLSAIGYVFRKTIKLVAILAGLALAWGLLPSGIHDMIGHAVSSFF
ncbi:MAG: hypothetical protein IK077_16695 [Thermoguttaceae bacterium]|nr:hypothetical protein [Thermoguttaceae bacterium]